MGTTQDGMMAALGPGQLNDLLLAYYKANGATSSNITDAEYEFLIAQGASPRNVQDMWEEYLESEGWSGSVDDMKNSYWVKLGGGTVLGPNLWRDPIPQTVDENNYSTYDSETGISRIVSSGTFIKLPQPDSLVIGINYRVIANSIGATTGSIAFEDPPQPLSLDGVPYDFTATTTSCSIKRNSTPCDVSFGFSVREVL